MHLPLGSTYTAERAAYRTLISRGREWFPEGGALGFDVRECAQNDYNDWIGAQIRADVYGWVAPGDPDLAAQLATVDAQLSHVGEGVYGAVVVAVIGARRHPCAYAVSCAQLCDHGGCHQHCRVLCRERRHIRR